MNFEFGGAPELAAPRESVWHHLRDGEMMAACTPGKESFEIRGPGRYTVTCSVGAGLLRVHVVLEAELHDLVHPESLRLRAVGTAPGSTLEVETMVRLEAVTPQRTRLSWSSVTSVHGMLAKFGRGMVEDTLRQFTERFWANVATRVAAAPRSGAYLLDGAGLLTLSIEELRGVVLLAGVSLGNRTLPKGHRLEAEDAASLLDAARAGALERPMRLAWLDHDELHESDAADLLASAVAGPGVTRSGARQGRIDLHAHHRGVLTIAVSALEQINAIEPLELFTRWNHQPVEARELIGSIKTGPHVVARAAVLNGVRLAEEHRPLIEVRPYLGLTVGAIIAEPLAPDAAARFESAARLRTESLDGRFLGVWDVSGADPGTVLQAARERLDELALQQGVGLLLIGGVSAGDPLAPFIAGLESLGGSVIRRGVPAHPGSMLWLGRLGGTQLLGLPRCGAFSMATAADLLLPRLMTGEEFTAASVASLGHGGVLGREMRSRFPEYARGLPEAPDS